MGRVEYRGPKQDKGTEARDLDPKVALLEDLTKAVSKPPMVSVVINRSVDVPEAPVTKVGQKEAWYVAEGPYPLVCSACRFWVYESSCDLVKGTIDPMGSCRYWKGR